MNELSKEIKIAEKLKFWEEQDQINKELIPRVIKNHEMITEVAAQFDKNLSYMSLLQESIDKTNEEIGSLHEELKSESHKQTEQIREMKNMIITQEEEISELKKSLERVVKSLAVTGSNKGNLAVNIGVLIAMILSIIAIIL